MQRVDVVYGGRALTVDVFMENILVYSDTIDGADINHSLVPILNGSNKEIVLSCIQIDIHEYCNKWWQHKAAPCGYQLII